MVIKQGRPSEARKPAIWAAQVEHDRLVRLRWQNKYGKVLDQSTQKIGRVNIIKPGWYKDVGRDLSEGSRVARPLNELITIMNFPPKYRRFPPYEDPGPEITEHVPRLSLQIDVPEEERASVLAEFGGRFDYLKRRHAVPINQRYVQPPNINATYGWHVLKKIRPANVPRTTPPPDEQIYDYELNRKRYGHNPVVAQEFYRSAGAINARKNSVILDISK